MTTVPATGDAAGRGDLAELSGGWHTEVRRDDGALDDLAAEWRELSAHCATATPFQSHAWLSSWWRSYGRSGRLRMVLVRRHGQLVAGAAMVRGHWAGIPVLSPVGYRLSDFTDVLLHDECTAEAAQLLADRMVVEAGAGVVDLPEVRPRAAAWPLAQAWPTSSWLLPASTCLELDAAPIEEAIDRLSRSTAKGLRKKLRYIERHAIDIREVPSPEAMEAVNRLVALHQLQWRGRRITREHLRPRFAAHLGWAATHMIADGQAVLREYRHGGRLLGAYLLVVGKQFVGGYLYGIHPDLSRLVDITTLLLRENMSTTLRLERPVYSMLRGAEAHKLRWRPRAVVSQRVILAGTWHPVAAVYAAAARGRARAIALLDERSPWLREMISRRTRRGRAPIRPDGRKP